MSLAGYEFGSETDESGSETVSSDYDEYQFDDMIPMALGPQNAYKRLSEFSRVPRYLFRTMSPSRGGGPTVSINTALQTVPPAFVAGQAHEPADPFRMSESKFRAMAQDHVYERVVADRLTEFSSWTASIHVAINYAQMLISTLKEPDVKICVMDLSVVENVRAWHCPDIIRLESRFFTTPYEEFLVHGPIRGRGYKAVTVAELYSKGLGIYIPERPNTPSIAEFHSLLWSKHPAVLSYKDRAVIRPIALLYEDLALPVTLALISARRRFWERLEGGEVPIGWPSWHKLQLIRNWLTPMEREQLIIWTRELWVLPKMIDTTLFPEVRQWLDLTFALGRHVALEFLKRGKKLENYHRRGK